jgi:hypothetical protein
MQGQTHLAGVVVVVDAIGGNPISRIQILPKVMPAPILLAGPVVVVVVIDLSPISRTQIPPKAMQGQTHRVGPVVVVVVIGLSLPYSLPQVRPRGIGLGEVVVVQRFSPSSLLRALWPRSVLR